MTSARTKNLVLKTLVLASAALAVAPDAWALNNCVATMNSKNGTINVRADGVHGVLLWGWDPGRVVATFDNAATCLQGNTARGCKLGAKGTPERVTPPPLCTIHLADDTGSCQDYIAGCVAGSRPICPPDMEQVGSWCIDRDVTDFLEYGPAVASCQGKGRSLCPLEAMIECDTNRAGANFPASSCAAVTDGGTFVWTITPHAADNQNFFTFMTVYQDDNVANVQATNIGSQYKSFCCSRLGGP